VLYRENHDGRAQKVEPMTPQKHSRQAHRRHSRQDEISSSRHIIRSLKAQADEKRTLSEKIADWITNTFGTMTFLVINVIWFVVWLVWNTEIIPGVEPFDPFPFGLLTTIVSLEAIILAIFVLISQNRAERVDDLRQEMDLQVDMIAEEELTKLMRMVSLLLEKNGIDISQDEELQGMLAPTNVEKLEKILENQIKATSTKSTPETEEQEV
jgi:uncharacterized membrane protein